MSTEFAGITDDDIAALDIVIRSEFDDLDDTDMDQVFKYSTWMTINCRVVFYSFY
jgi:hypothetical protein